MADDDATKAEQGLLKYFPETRTTIVCWMMFSSFLVIVLCWWKPPPADSQLLNTLIGMYVGTGFITAITWWMGSSKGSDANNKIVDKLTDVVRPAPPAVPAAAPWWSLLTEAEKGLITVSAANDPRVQAFITTSATGHGTSDDLSYLVTKGLLTQDRATAIQAS